MNAEEAVFTVLNFLCLFLMNCQRPTSTSLSPFSSLPLSTHPGHLGVVRASWDNRQYLDNFLKLMLSEEKKDPFPGNRRNMYNTVGKSRWNSYQSGTGILLKNNLLPCQLWFLTPEFESHLGGPSAISIMGHVLESPHTCGPGIMFHTLLQEGISSLLFPKNLPCVCLNRLHTMLWQLPGPGLCLQAPAQPTPL